MTTEYHGRGGPLTVSDGWATPISDVLKNAIKELAYPATDFNENAESTEGMFISIISLTIACISLYVQLTFDQFFYFCFKKTG